MVFSAVGTRSKRMPVGKPSKMPKRKGTRGRIDEKSITKNRE